MIKEMELAVSRDFRGGESILLSVVLSQINTFKMFFFDGDVARDSSREAAIISMVIRAIFVVVVDEDDEQ